MAGDSVVHGLAFASVTFREATYDAKRRHYSISAQSMGTYSSRQKFICVNFIDSTSIGVSPISLREEAVQTKKGDVKIIKHFTPMLKPDGVQSFIQWTDASKNSSAFYARREATLHALYMIELHPERISYRYANIDPDTDGTKLWELK
jgi:hypothetical protein